MTKQDNVFYLYDQLGKAGQRGEAKEFISKLCGISVGTVKNHWIQDKYFPGHVTKEQLTAIKECFIELLLEEQEDVQMKLSKAESVKRVEFQKRLTDIENTLNLVNY